MTNQFKIGDNVCTSGKGRTKNWKKHCGKVKRIISKNSVEIIWNNTHFGDEMQLSEIKKK